MNDYKNITTKENYQELIDCGMFWEFYPELSGQWDIDKLVILKNCQKYLVRPDDYHIFEIDEFNGCYRSYTTKNIRSDGTRPNAQKHFTYENLTKNYNFFPITEEEIPTYEEKHNLYFEFISWQTRSDGHGGVKGGTFEEFLAKKYKDAFNNPNAFALTAENIDKSYDRYDLLCKDVKHQIGFIDDYYEFDFDFLIETLKEMKKLQLKFRK